MVHYVMELLQSSLRVLPLTLIVVCTVMLKISNPEHTCILIFYAYAERYWEMIDRLKVTHFYVIPTVMKFLMKAGDEHVDKYNLSTLKVLALGTTVL